MGIFLMLFTVDKPFKSGNFELTPGKQVQVYPRKDNLIHLHKDGRDFILAPFILKYLRDIDFPTLDKLSEWSMNTICESPTGHLVEHDGTGPDGFHSWFRYLGFV
jgi:hypothetical protein